MAEARETSAGIAAALDLVARVSDDGRLLSGLLRGRDFGRDDLRIADVAPSLARALDRGPAADGRMEFWVDSYGERLYFEGRSFTSADGERTIVGWDVTARRLRERALTHQAYHDDLTQLPNRVFFRQRLQEALAEIADVPIAVVMIGLSGFKSVNLLAGQRSGDIVLAAVADRLVTSMPEGGTAARLVGDEFAVLLRGEDDPHGIAESLIASIAQPVEVEGYQYAVHAHAGYTIATDDLDGPSELLRDADLALSQARLGAADQVVAFEPSMYKAVVRRQALRTDLEAAVGAARITPVYQRVVDLVENMTVGSEALARWDHPGRGEVTPDQFIPLAERSGLIGALGRQILLQACRDAVSAGEDSGWVSVNVSPQQLLAGNHFVAEVGEILEATGLPPERLILELTEGAFIADSQRAVAVLTQIRSLGVQVALDDFGTGYSSLAYLSSYPVDALKIDKTFTDWVTVDDLQRRLVEAVIRLGEILSLRVVAEGIETEEQRDILLELGCRYGQGFLLGRPAARLELD